MDSVSIEVKKRQQGARKGSREKTGTPRRHMLLFALVVMIAWTFGGWVVFVNFGCDLNESPWKSTTLLHRSDEESFLDMPTNQKNTTDMHNALRIEKELQMAHQARLDAEKRAREAAQAAAEEERKLKAEIEKLTLKSLEIERESKLAFNRLKEENAEKHKQELEQLVLQQQQQREQQQKVAQKEADMKKAEAEVKEQKQQVVDAAKVENNLVKQVAELDLVKYVDIRRGTDNRDWRSLSRGNALPIISLPLGMTHWAVTNKLGIDAWWFNPKRVTFAGIRCTHQPSPWIGDYGFFDVFPFTAQSMREGKYNTDSAIFMPHYMKLELTSHCAGSCTTVEFVGTKHGGIMKVEFPSTGGNYGIRFSHLMNINGAVESGSGDVVITAESRKTSVFKVPTHTNHRMVARIQFSGGVATNKVISGSQVSFEARASTTVVIRFGTSFISLDQAKLNLNREVGSYELSTLNAAGRKSWNEILGRVEVEADSTQASEATELKTMLYSCIYRALIWPRQLGEVDSSGKLVHYSPHARAGGVFPGQMSTDQGFWDSYRAHYPMLHLLYPDLVIDVMEGWVNAVREDPNQMLAQWSSPGRVGSMVGSMGEVSLCEGIINGAITGQSAQDAFTYMKRSALEAVPTGRDMLAEYKRLGYVPEKSRKEGSVSLTLNYLLSDYSVSKCAEFMGDSATAATLKKRSLQWHKIWDSSTLFFRPKKEDGSFVNPFDQYKWMGPYTEGGPWQYRFYVPHDPSGLSDAYGGKGAMCKKLIDTMTGPSTVSNRNKIHEELEMQQHSFGQYSHNNQPVHHMLYMFAHCNCVAEGQKWIHHTLRTQYGPFGFAGDEDNGENASWYILSSFGLYSLVPGSGEYQVGSPPLFKKVVIRRKGRGGDLVIQRNVQISTNPKNDFTPSNSIKWNDRTIDISKNAVTIPYKELLNGGNLVFF